MIQTGDPIFDAVIAGATDGHLVVSSITQGAQGASSQSFHVTEAPAALATARALATSRNVYLASALQAEPVSAGKRGSENGAAQFSVISLDFDGAWGHHAESKLPEAKSDLARLVEAAGAPEPEIVLDTGGGLLAVWTIEPFALNSPEDVRRAKALSKGFQKRLRETALQRFGWKLDGTADLCRLIRLPQTLNHKFTPPRRVEVFNG